MQSFHKICQSLNLTVHGRDVRISGVNTPIASTAKDLIFLLGSDALKDLNTIRARAAIIDQPLLNDKTGNDLEQFGITYAGSQVIREHMAIILGAFLKRPWGPTAERVKRSRISKRAVISKLSSLGRGCTIGTGVVIHPHVSIGNGVEIGENTVIFPNVTIYDNCIVGKRTILHAGCVIGSDGFGYYEKDGRHHKIPHIGKVVIEDDVEIGANSSVDRGTIGETRIKRGTKIDNLVQIAHNVIIGENGLLAAQVGIAGSTTIGNRVIIAGQAGLVGHITVGDEVVIAAQSGVIKSIDRGQTVSGYPARPHLQALRTLAHVDRLQEMEKRLDTLWKQNAKSRGENDS